MDAIILFSHGSLLCGAGETLRAHARRLQESGVAPRVEVGFLNFSEPDFLTTVAELVKDGVTQIRIAPYFLIPGKFVKVDLPRRMDEAKTQFPQVEFTVAEPLGFDPRLADALLDSAAHAKASSHWRDTLNEATAHCRPDPQCPLYDTPLCPKHSGTGQLPDVATQTSETSTPSPEPRVTDRVTQKTALLVMVHGSPRPVANEEMYRVVELLKSREDAYPILEVGFMEVNEPTIPEAIDTCVAKGATEIIAVPYFLHTGTHVADDLPTLLEAGRARYPDTDFRLGDYLGKSEILTEILRDRIKASSVTR